jgi:NAD(P)-dependent dehydrogenase (short-subunit alcohol dehydrogenase family)
MNTELDGRSTVVVGASRGLGRGIADAFAAAGARVVAIARSAPGDLAADVPFEVADVPFEVADVRFEAADAADPATPPRILATYQPEILVVVAGATPVSRPLHEHTWDTFSVHWHSDVKIAFGWVREALVRPLPPGSRVIVVSSGAAVNGSAVSGGYAGAKATQRFIAAYAQDESGRAGLGITFTTVLPVMTPAGGVGQEGIRAYAARSGRTPADFVAGLGEPLTAETAGAAVVELVRSDPAGLAPGYLLTAAGLQKLP